MGARTSTQCTYFVFDQRACRYKSISRKAYDTIHQHQSLRTSRALKNDFQTQKVGCKHIWCRVGTTSIMRPFYVAQPGTVAVSPSHFAIYSIHRSSMPASSFTGFTSKRWLKVADVPDNRPLSWANRCPGCRSQRAPGHARQGLVARPRPLRSLPQRRRCQRAHGTGARVAGRDPRMARPPPHDVFGGHERSHGAQHGRRDASSVGDGDWRV